MKKKIEAVNADEVIIEGSEEFQDAVRDFIRHRESIGIPMTELALNRNLKKLKRLGETEEIQIAILDRSIHRLWSDIYALPDDELMEITGRRKVKPSGFNNFTQKEYDYEQFEKDNLKKMMDELKPYASGKSIKGPIRPTRFSNFEQAPPDFDAIRKKKRAQLMQHMAEMNSKGTNSSEGGGEN